jgi:hypothetical protein
MAGQRKRDLVIFFTGVHPAPGQTVLGGVDGVAGALAGEVGDEEIDVGQVAVRVAVAAQQEIAGSQDVEEFLGPAGCLDRFHVAQLHGETTESGRRGGNDFGAAACLQQNSRQRDQAGGKTQAKSAGSLRD